MYYLYVHTLPNGKRYIGVTDRIEKRWNHGRGYFENEDFTRDINRYGWDNIRHDIIDSFTEREVAEHFEQLYTILFDSENPAFGYNKTKWRESLLKKYEEKISVAELDLGKEQDKEPEQRNIFDIYQKSYDAGNELINQWILNEKHRQVVKDRLLNGLTFTELAKKYNLSIRQVKNIVYDCQYKLSKHM